MLIADHPSTPEWVSTDTIPNGGLDLTGLRLPVLTIGGQLLDGITTVTPLVRYHSLQAWIISSYIHARLPDARASFQEFAAKVEAAIAIGNLIHTPGRTGLVGAIEASMLARGTTETIDIKRLVKQLATTLYQNPGTQLGISRQRKTVPGLTAERGEALATCVQAAVANTALGRRFSDGELIDGASRAEIRSFGAAAGLLGASTEELGLLISCILPSGPQTASEQNRVHTYTVLLGLAASLHCVPSQNDFFVEAASLHRTSCQHLHKNLDGWLRHLVRDSLAVAHEHVLQEVLICLHDRSLGARMVYRESVIDDVCESFSAAEAVLRELHLLQATESAALLAFSDLFARVRALVTENDVVEAGLRRWDSSLSEVLLIGQMLHEPVTAIFILPVLWCTATLRAEHWLEPETPFEGRRGFGWDLIGVCDVIRPELDRFAREKMSLLEVARELALRTVEQHLRVSWSRMASDPRHDVALLISDGDAWQSRDAKHVQEYAAGRTDSRVGRAISWLEQLGLISVGGLTPRGTSVYATLCSARPENA